MSRTIKIGLLLLVSAGILTAIVLIVGVAKTAEAVQEAGFLAFGTAGLLSVTLLVLQASAWAALNRAIDHRVSFRTLLEAVTVGLGANILTPSTYLGGEPVKVVYVGSKAGLPYQEVAGTVVLAKYLEGLSFVLFFSVCTVIATVLFSHILFEPIYVVWGISLPSPGVMLLGLAAVLLLFCTVLWLSLSRHWRPLTRVVGWLARTRIARKFFVRLRGRTRQMERQVSRVFTEERQSALEAFLLFFLTHVVMLVKPAVFFLVGWKIGLGLGKLSLIFVACQTLLAFQITPSGAGTLDGGMIAVFALLDPSITDSQVMAYLLCIRFWDIVVVGTGFLLAARVGVGFLAGESVVEAAAASGDDSNEDSEDAA